MKHVSDLEDLPDKNPARSADFGDNGGEEGGDEGADW